MDYERLPWKLRYDLLRRVASRMRRLEVQATHRHATIRFGRGCYLGPGFNLYIPDRGQLIVGDNVEFRRGFTCEILAEGRVTIGDDCVFTYNTVIQCSTAVDIGNRCVFAAGSLIVDGSHRFRGHDRPPADQGFDFRPITIGDDSMVMAKSTVIAPIGKRSFVGANSVVTRPIPDFSLAVGTPARVVERYAPDDGEDAQSAPIAEGA